MFFCQKLKKISLLSLPAIYLFSRSLNAFASIKPEDLIPPKGPSNLPHGDLFTDFIPAIVKIILQISGTLAMAALVVSGVLMATSSLNEEQINTAKKIITYSLLGLIIIATSYAIIYGISQFSFL